MNGIRGRLIMKDNLYPELTILGAGLSGLSLAYHYPGKSTIFEKLDKIGGTARTEEENGFYYDYGPHVSFTTDPYVINLFSQSTRTLIREAKPFNSYQGKEFPHPVLHQLDTLPRDEAFNILIDLIKAYKEYDKNYIPLNYEDWLIKNQGEYFAKHYTNIYTKKFWLTDAKDLTTDWVGLRIPIPSIETAVKGALGFKNDSGYYFQKFRYPEKGGFVSFTNFWRVRERDIKIFLNKEVTLIDTKNKLIKFSDGSIKRYKILASTIPIPEMPNIFSNISDNIKNMISKLRYTSLHYINLAVKGNFKRDFTWLYFYDEDIPITRLILYNNMSPNMSPDGYTALQLEIPYINKFDKSLVKKSILAIEKLGYLDSKNIVSINEKDLKYGYVIYDSNRKKYLDEIKKYFKESDIYLLGRYGSWAYLWSHDVVIQGKEVSQEILKDMDKINVKDYSTRIKGA
jgi:protoporphyrinogen oxidase